MKTQQVSTGAFIVREDGKFLIIQRSIKEDFLPGYWELPGGGSDYGETPEEALKREIEEECRLDIQIHVPLTIAQYFIEEVQRIEIIFLCSMKKEGQNIELSDEHSTYAWISMEELRDYRTDDFMVKVLSEASAHLDYWMKTYILH